MSSPTSPTPTTPDSPLPQRLPPLPLYNLSKLLPDERVRHLLALYFRATHAIDIPDTLPAHHRDNCIAIIDTCFAAIVELEHRKVHLKGEMEGQEGKVEWILECCGRLEEQKSGSFEAQKLDAGDIKPLTPLPPTVQRDTLESVRATMEAMKAVIETLLYQEEAVAINVTIEAVFKDLDELEKEVREISEKHRDREARVQAAEYKRQTVWWEVEELADDCANELGSESVEQLRKRWFYHVDANYKPDGKSYWVYDLYDQSRGL